jgi:hypothetical protein
VKEYKFIDISDGNIASIFRVKGCLMTIQQGLKMKLNLERKTFSEGYCLLGCNAM